MLSSESTASADSNILDVVDENDRVIGRAGRVEIHQQGLRHREINVLFVTPSGDVIFQRRKGGLLDAAVGGHVELGQDYIDAALMEVREESGVDASADNLMFLGKIAYDELFPNSAKPVNKGFRAVYAYVYRGAIADLRIEEGKAVGFETAPLSVCQDSGPRLPNVNPCLLTPEYISFYKKLAQLMDGLT